MKLEDQHGKPYFYNPEDSSVRWELPQVNSWRRERAGEGGGGDRSQRLSPQVPIPAPRSVRKSSQDSDTPAQASPPEEKVGKGHGVWGQGLVEYIPPFSISPRAEGVLEKSPCACSCRDITLPPSRGVGVAGFSEPQA